MYLPVDVLLDEPPVAVVIGENPSNVEPQHLQHQHPLSNYQQQQHPQDIQQPPALNHRDQYCIQHQQTYFLQPFQTQQPQYSALASSLHSQHVSFQSGDHIFHQHPCEFEQDKRHRQNLNPQQLAPCADCHQPIKDRFYLLVAERCWHIDCLRCSMCKATLESHGTCFAREGAIYCKDDYYQRFCKRCARCNHILSPKELVMRAKEFIFHMHCFNCVVCSSPLQPGDYFALAPSGLLYCQHHYEPLFYGSGTVPVIPPVGSPTGSDIDIPGARIGFGTMAGSPGKNSCADGMDTVGGTTKGKGQKGRSKKKKSSASDDRDMAQCMAAQADMTIAGHLHPSSIRDQHPSMMSGCAGANVLLTSRPGICQVGNTGGLIQSGRSSPASGAGGCSSSSIHSQPSQQQAARSKRMRTSFKHHQLRTMKAYFTLNHNPDAKDLKQLAQKTGLTKRVLQVWFQNARAKYRRSMQSKQQDPQNPSKSPGPTNTSGGAGSSSDIGENTAFATDPEDHSIDADGLIGDVASRRHSSDSSNASSEYSHASGEGRGSGCRSGFNDETGYGPIGNQSHPRPASPNDYSPVAGSRPLGPSAVAATSGSEHGCFPAELPHEDMRQLQRFRDQNEDDSASKSLADYFQQCQGGLL